MRWDGSEGSESGRDPLRVVEVGWWEGIEETREFVVDTVTDALGYVVALHTFLEVGACVRERGGVDGGRVLGSLAEILGGGEGDGGVHTFIFFGLILVWKKKEVLLEENF